MTGLKEGSKVASIFQQKSIDQLKSARSDHCHVNEVVRDGTNVNVTFISFSMNLVHLQELRFRSNQLQGDMMRCKARLS